MNRIIILLSHLCLVVWVLAHNDIIWSTPLLFFSNIVVFALGDLIVKQEK